MIDILKKNINLNIKLFIIFLNNNNIIYKKIIYKNLIKIIIKEYIILYISNDYYILQKKIIAKYKKYIDYKYIVIKTSNNYLKQIEVKNIKQIEKQYDCINIIFEYKLFFDFITNKIKEGYILAEYITSENKTYKILTINKISYKIKNKYYKEVSIKEIEKYIIKNFYKNKNGLLILKKEILEKKDTKDLFTYIFYNLNNQYFIEDIIIEHKIKQLNIEIINGFLNEITFDKINIKNNIKKYFEKENINITLKELTEKTQINVINIDI